jgi:type I restriction enzyme R subunit
MGAKMQLTEEDVKLRYITPNILNKNWLFSQIRMEYLFTNGQVNVQGNIVSRGLKKKADYLLFHKSGNIPLAIVEAKDNSHSVGSGMQQAIEYAKTLNVPFAYSSNGIKFLEHDFLTGLEKELNIDEFPTNDELWARYKRNKNINQSQEIVLLEDYFIDTFSPKAPRYYQSIAINKTIEAFITGQKRMLLVMATGTGKTLTAFQIIWKLWKTGKAKKVLYLADRNILIDQTMQQDFKPFKNSMTKIQSKVLDSAYEIYLSLYQRLIGSDGEEIFREFKPDFFDFIIVDEAHRGSAKDDSQWRKILSYFNSAVQLGMTATPKETRYISNITYFGEPIYTYSLKQGIADGFLAPYKVHRISIDRDVEGWRPPQGMLDKDGNPIPDEVYEVKDFDKKIIIDERTQEVAKRITDWLKENGRFSKTIVFCVDIDHAERMRQALINLNSDLVKENSDYIMRITGDNPEGKAKLDYFIDPNEKYPTIVTTSKLMTTGVDAKTTRLIVLDSMINSLTEFKQIIGRGTRLLEDYNKFFFTIMDFRGVTKHFYDPGFDGDPLPIPPVDPPDGLGVPPGGPPPNEPPDEDKKIYVNGIEVKIIGERISYYGPEGKLITESLIDYTKKNLLKQYATLDSFINEWTHAEKKSAIIDELRSQGILLDALKIESKKDLDDFDLILHIAFDKLPLTKKDRVANVKKRGYLNKYSEVCQKILSNLLDKYMDGGISQIEDTRILNTHPFDEFGSPTTIAGYFGGKDLFIQAINEMSSILYSSSI